MNAKLTETGKPKSEMRTPKEARMPQPESSRGERAPRVAAPLPCTTACQHRAPYLVRPQPGNRSAFGLRLSGLVRASNFGLRASLLLLLALPLVAAEPDVRRDATVLAVEKVMPAVVNIATATVSRNDPLDEWRRQFFDPYHRSRPPGSVGYSMGSGVIIDEEGYLLTNNHVVSQTDEIWVKPSTTTNTYRARVVAQDPKTDLALLKIEAPAAEKFTAVEFGQGDDLLLGETVLALGNPFGLGGSVSRGILSSKSRVPPSENEQLDIPNWLQTDAAVNPGNSGGPLVNLQGQLIGLNVAILRQAQGINFAIPIRRIVEALTDMITPESSTRRLWFGAQIRAGRPPFTITAVTPESPAAKAGLKTGDVIVEINGEKPAGFISLNERLLSEKNPEPKLTVERSGQRRTLTVRLVDLSTFYNTALIRKLLGISLQELTPKLAQTLGFRPGIGLAVAGVDRDVAGAEALVPGAVVTMIDGRRVGDPVDAARLISNRAVGERVRLDFLVRQQRGPLVTLRQDAVELPVR
jgi:serine protease Do